tara:strand:- start:2773 stop:3189 length:417 start_codon:yes stop_codon:yes gene_type:complete
MSDYVKNVLSHKIYNKMHNADGRSQEVAIDPATIVLIAKISISVIRFIKNCKGSAEEREGVIRNPGIDGDGILKSIVRKKLGWFKYFFIGAKVIRAIKEIGSEVKHDELNSSGLFDDLGEDGRRKSGVFDNGQRYYEI